MRNSHGRNRWGAPKGHQKIKENRQLEIPFETAVREVNEEICYLNIETQQWSSLKIEILRNYDKYLECTLKNKANYRRIGLFIVHLQEDWMFSVKDDKEIDVCMKICTHISFAWIKFFFSESQLVFIEKTSRSK